MASSCEIGPVVDRLEPPRRFAQPTRVLEPGEGECRVDDRPTAQLGDGLQRLWFRSARVDQPAVVAARQRPRVVTHPTGYTGSGGSLPVTVCIDPTTANAASMVVPVQNIVATWNARAAASPNLFFGANNNIGSSQYDFESTALHELGHCIGLAHPNLSSESGLSGSDQNYTKATSGGDGAYDLGIGADGIRGYGLR